MLPLPCRSVGRRVLSARPCLALALTFRLADEFRNEPFNGTTYASAGEIPATELAAASVLLDVATGHLHEPDFGPPTARYPFGPLLPGFASAPRALFYYDQYGYWTSVNSALACWAVIAADAG